MERQLQKNVYRIQETVLNGNIINYSECFSDKRTYAYKKDVYSFRGYKIAFTQKQIDILRLIANGFSNLKIAQELRVKESSVKLLIYRLMKHLGAIICEDIDRFYLVVLAQEIWFENESCFVETN